jgi:hypothetical protein
LVSRGCEFALSKTHHLHSYNPIVAAARAVRNPKEGEGEGGGRGWGFRGMCALSAAPANAPVGPGHLSVATVHGLRLGLIPRDLNRFWGFGSAVQNGLERS